jgi:hypothetical protein
MGETVDIELTGLADLGTSRMACLRVAGAEEAFTLHKGETAFGITLKDIDARAGWACVERGTNQYKLRLVERCVVFRHASDLAQGKARSAAKSSQ